MHRTNSYPSNLVSAYEYLVNYNYKKVATNGSHQDDEGGMAFAESRHQPTFKADAAANNKAIIISQVVAVAGRQSSGRGRSGRGGQSSTNNPGQSDRSGSHAR